MACPSSPARIFKRLEGKVVMITGGASGIGEATARLFVKHGAKVVIADIQDELGRAVCQDVASEDQLSFIHCDVTKEHDVQQAVDAVVAKHGKLDAVVAKHGKLDIMFSNAGIENKVDKSIALSELDDLKRVFEVNVFGAFLCAKHAARVMIPAKKGCIIFTSSATASVAGIVHHIYVSSKHAVNGLMKNLCVELGQYGIRVNCVSPHAISTAILRRGTGLPKEYLEAIISEAANLKGETLEVNDIAEAVLYLGSDESKYVSGLNLLVDGGYSTTNPSIPIAMSKASSRMI